jgi:predicted XRE-type DNA-binding protein
MDEKIKVHSSSGNVFADLGLPNPEELLIKAELTHQISEIISTRQLTENEAAELLAIDRSNLSTLLRGKLSDFSVEQLFRFLNALGSNIEIHVMPSQPDLQAQTRIVMARSREFGIKIST